jgi:hypothetical protein
VLLTALSVALLAPPPASSCAFDGVFSGNLPVSQYQGSIDVALAIRAAYDQDVVGRKAVEQPIPGQAGYWRAATRLGKLRFLLSAAAQREPPSSSSISVLLFDSSLWSRFSPSERGYDVAVHTNGPNPGDIVVVTSEALLATILEHRLPIATALDRGLIAIEGAEERKAAARRLVTAALTLRADSDLRAEGTQVPPVRFFGPERSVRPK